MALRISPAHKKLQDRLDQMRKYADFFYLFQNRILKMVFYYRFRRQHEQLRTVIVRVLRPTAVVQPVGTPEDETAQDTSTQMVLDASDATAIEVSFFNLRKN